METVIKSDEGTPSPITTPNDPAPENAPNTPNIRPSTPNFTPETVTLDKKRVPIREVREFKEIKAEFGKITVETHDNKEDIQKLLVRMQSLEQRVDNVEEKIAEQEKVLDELRRDFDREREDRQDYQVNLDTAMTSIHQEIQQSKEKTGSSASDERISLLERDLGILVKEHEIIEAENREREYICSCVELQEFYDHTQLKLSELFYAAKVISSGLVDKSKNQTGSKVLNETENFTNTASDVTSKMSLLVKNFPTMQVFTFAHETLSKVIPFMGIITGSVASVVKSYQNEKNKQEIKEIKSLNIMMPSIKDVNDISEKVARKLTLKYEHQIKQLTTSSKKDGNTLNGGTQLLAECAVARIIDFLKATEFHKELNFVDQMVFATFESASSNTIKDPFLQFKQQIPTKLNLNWSDKGIFSQLGVVVDGKCYVSKNTSQD
jgi:uncharacterized coiled-coil protein SlyX